MKKILSHLGGIAQLLELGLVVLFVIVGPFIWMYRLCATDRLLGAISVALAWLVSISILVISWRRSLPVAVPLGIFLGWLIVLAFALSPWLFG